VRVRHGLAGLDANKRHAGLVNIDAHDFGGADGGLLISGVVDHELIAGLHAAQEFHCNRIGDSIPDGLALALEIRKGIYAGLSLQQIRHRLPPVSLLLADSLPVRETALCRAKAVRGTGPSRSLLPDHDLPSRCARIHFAASASWRPCRRDSSGARLR